MTSTERELPHFEPVAIERMRLAKEPGFGLSDYFSQGVLWAIAGGGTAAVIHFLCSHSVKADDALSFVGAVVGAAATVAGAASLADRKEAKERRDEQEVILSAINDLRHALGGLLPLYSKSTEEEDYSSTRKELAERHGSRFMHGDASVHSEFFGEVIAHAKTLTFHQRQSVKGLCQALDACLALSHVPGGWEVTRQKSALGHLSARANKAGLAFSSGRRTPFSRQ